MYLLSSRTFKINIDIFIQVYKGTHRSVMLSSCSEYVPYTVRVRYGKSKFNLMLTYLRVFDVHCH